MQRRSTFSKIHSLVHAWLVLDFFGEARRTGGAASTLTTSIFSQSFLALVVAALLYPEPPPVPFAAANLSLSTLLVALAGLDVEPLAARTVADRVLLRTAPVGRVAAAVARIAHGTFHLGLLTIGMALPPGILLACREGNVLLLPAYLLLAVLVAGIATGTLTVVLGAARLWFGGQRAALLAGTCKALLLGFGFALFALSLPTLQKTADALPIGRTGAELLPQFHAAKLLAFPVADAWRLLVLGVWALALVLAQAWLGDRERERPPQVRRPGLLVRLTARAAGPQADKAVAQFCATMLWRSSSLRSRVLPLLGVPAAMAALALVGSDTQSQRMLATMALQFPAIYLPFVIAFLPHADQPGCRWVFDSGPELAPARVQRAVWLALVLCLLLPVQIVALTALLLAGLPPVAATAAALFALGSGGLFARVMVRSLEDLPFCRDDAAEQGLEFGNLIGYGLALAGLGAAAAVLPPLTALALGALTTAALVMQMRPRS